MGGDELFQSPLGEVVKETMDICVCVSSWSFVSIPSRGSGKGNSVLLPDGRCIFMFQSPLGEVVKETYFA